MTATDIAKADLVYNGEIIHAKAETLSLTDMWKAAKSPANREPFNWSRKEGASFIEAVAVAHNLPTSQVMKTKQGKGGGTFAHWQIGLAYAKYLSPEFHMWCNTVVRSVMEGRAVASDHSLTKYDMQMIGNAVKNCTGVVIREELRELLAAILPQAVNAALADRSIMIRRGRTAQDLLASFGFPRGIKGLTLWAGNRMDALGIRMNGNEKADRGDGSIRLYDPDKAEAWLRSGGRHLIEQKVAERKGQGRLRLVG